MLFMDYKAVPEVREVRENMLKTMRDMPVSNNASGFYDTWFLDKNQVITHISLVSISEKTIYGVDEYILDKNGRISNINKTEKLVKEDVTDFTYFWNSLIVHKQHKRAYNYTY